MVLGLALAILPLTAHRYGRVGDGRNYEGRWRATVSGARRGFREERLLVVLGYIGAQTWLPIVGVVADMYRGGDLALSG